MDGNDKRPEPVVSMRSDADFGDKFKLYSEARRGNDAENETPDLNVWMNVAAKCR